MKKVVYISGPITGVSEYRRAFEQAEQDIVAAGYIPLNPARLPEGLSNAQYMRINFAQIDAADAVLLLDGWEKSRGCWVESSYCMYIGKPYATSIDDLKEVLGDARTE